MEDIVSPIGGKPYGGTLSMYVTEEEHKNAAETETETAEIWQKEIRDVWGT